MIGVILLVLVTADIYARIEKHKRLKADSLFFSPFVSREQIKNIKTKEQEAAWLSCNDRNTFGYIFMPLVGLGGLITYIILRALGTTLPAIPLSFTLQAVLVAALLATFAISSIYLYFHHDNGTEPGIIDELSDDELQQRSWSLKKAQELAVSQYPGRYWIYAKAPSNAEERTPDSSESLKL